MKKWKVFGVVLAVKTLSDYTNSYEKSETIHFNLLQFTI